MCDACREDLREYYGDDEIYDLNQAFMEEHRDAGNAVAHSVCEDDNLELSHIIAAIHDISSEQWQRDRIAKGYERTIPFEDASDEDLVLVKKHLHELYKLGCKKIGREI